MRAIQIRNWEKDDDVVALTGMLHRAYAPLAAVGLRYMATHQSPEVTLSRLNSGTALVAECAGRIVGTVTIYQPDRNSSVGAYRDQRTIHFGQFGVDPRFRGKGIGKELHEAVIRHALEHLSEYIALDTASPATELIATYKRWGYRIIGRESFSSTNYESVIMRRPARACV